MKIIYTSHLEFRLRIRIRGIPYDLPRKVFQQTKKHYYDNLTKHHVAVHQVKFEDKLREMALIYDKTENQIEIITIHPLRPYQKFSRINSGRWEKI